MVNHYMVYLKVIKNAEISHNFVRNKGNIRTKTMFKKSNWFIGAIESWLIDKMVAYTPCARKFDHL